MEALVIFALGVPLILFDIGVSDYSVLNDFEMALNCLIIVAFLASFFYLNFKMTGVMLEAKLNEAVKRIYKVLLIILSSRVTMVTIEVLISVGIKDGSF